MLCLDIGNSQIYGGIFDGKNFTHNFRLNTKNGWSSDQIGVFICSYLRERSIDPQAIKQIAICSVVPSVNYSIRSACIKYFNIDPFILKMGVKTGLIVNKYKNPHEIGSDIIAGCVASLDLFPGHNLLVVDLGTATTIAAVNRNSEYFGGVIIPGLKTQADSLAVAAENLSSIDIILPKTVTGTSTSHAIQSGLFYGHLAAMRGLCNLMALEKFGSEKDCKIIGTGGFSILFADSDIFDAIEPDLILKGLVIAERVNTSAKT